MINTIINILNSYGISNNEDLIIPHIFVGNIKTSQDEIFLHKNNIKLIVNCSKNIKFLDNYNCEKIRVPIDDNKFFKNYDIINYLDVLDKIDLFKKNKKNILIHCQFGSQRSATLLLIYMVKFLKLDKKKAYNVIKQARPFTFFPNNRFEHILQLI